MPTPVKQATIQKPMIANGTPPTADSMLSRAVAVDDLVEQWQKFLIFGWNRVGKTSLAVEWPKPLLIVSFEPGTTGGAVSVNNVPGVTFLPVNSRAEAVRLAGELSVSRRSNWKWDGKSWQKLQDAKGNPVFVGDVFLTDVVDTVTSLQDLILKEIKGSGDVILQQNWGSITRDEYSQRSERCKEVMRVFGSQKCHTIFTAQEKDHSRQQEEGGSAMTRSLQVGSFMAADLGGATVRWLQDQCGYFGRLSVEKEMKLVRGHNTVQGKQIPFENLVATGKRVRRFRTILHDNFSAGFRSCNPDAIPEYLDCFTPKEMYEEVQKVIAGHRSAKGKYPTEMV